MPSRDRARATAPSALAWVAPFAHLLHERVGVVVPPSSWPGLAQKVERACRDSGFADVAAYQDAVATLPLTAAAVQRLLGRVTVNESYFFRDPGVIAALRDHILPALIERRRATRRLRLWVPGCATGEDVYVLAILAQQAGAVAPWTVDILGTDIDERALAVARAATYNEWSLRACNARERRRYFDDLGDRYRLSRCHRDGARFGFDNIIDAGWATSHPCDLVLFRNVAIYFDPHSTAAAYDKIARHLAADGVLIKSAADPEPPGPWRPLAAPHTTGLAFVQDSPRGRPRPGRQVRAPAPVPPAPAPDSERLARATALADSGHLDAALRLVSEIVARQPREWRAHLLAGMIAQELGERRAAETWLRAVLRLAPGLPIAHVRLGLLHYSGGDRRTAEHELRTARDLLRAGGQTRALGAEAWTTSELQALVEYHLSRCARETAP